MQGEELKQFLQDALKTCKAEYNDYCGKAVQAQTQGAKMHARNMRYYTTGKIDTIKTVLELTKQEN